MMLESRALQKMDGDRVVTEKAGHKILENSVWNAY